MPPLYQSRPARIGLAVALALLLAIGFIPLFGGPGYEISLAAGVVLPFAVAIAAALDLSSPQASSLLPVAALARAVSLAAVFALAAWATTLIHGLRAGFCDLLGGSAHFALGPACGALLAGAWGGVAGEIARSRRRRRLAAVLLAMAAPLACILVSVGRFVASPMIFAYDPFVGYFSGTVYDTVIDFSGLVAYRAGSAATLFAAFAAALHLARDERGRLRPALGASPAMLAAGAVALVASLAITLEGDRLGHWQTPATIAAALGARTSGARCDVVYPRSMRPADAERLARDCDAHVAAGERWFGAPGPARITAFVFESAGQKGALMGAADTFIAKPWRREVYVQASGYPHPVIGHEIMHVLAGAFGRGPFRIGGSLWGLVPDPGLIEGVAVAAAPPEGDLTPREWAKAMKDLGLLPPLDRLFGLGFLGQNASMAYTVSGAFVGWLHDRFGAAAVRGWYGGGSLPELTGKSWADLESAFRADLDHVELPEAARGQAKARFDRPGIFGRRCPHVVDGCKAGAERLRGGGDEIGAAAAFERVLELDPGDTGARIAIARTLLRRGKLEEGNRALQAIVDDGAVPRHLRDRALEEIADRALDDGPVAGAVARYRELMTRTVDEDALRTLELKILAARDPRGRPALVALLVGAGGRPPDRTMGIELLGRWASSSPADGVPWYLLGRQYMNAGQFEDGAERLDRALAAPIASERVRAEAERLRQVAACALGDRDGAARAYALYAAHAGVGEGRREAARALLERCSGIGAPPAAL